MKPQRNFRQPVLVLNPAEGESDEYGNEVEAFEDPRPYRGRLEQTRAREITIGRSTQISDWLLMLPRGAAISGNAIVLDEDDRVFEVLGPPSEERGVKGRVTHIEANLRHVEG